jgi:hypothetical protein
VGDRAAERRLRRRHRIDVDELRVLGDFGERVDPRLVDQDPVGDSDLFADSGAYLFEGGGGHSPGLERAGYETQDR